MLCPKCALLYAVLLAVLLDSISGRIHSKNRYISNQDGYPLSTPYAGSHGLVSYDKTYKNNYFYNPPQSLVYSPGRGRAPQHYPVYQGPPPNYLYKYINSGSKYGTLLTGLALLNLGALGAAAYSHLKQNSRRTPQTDEVCKFEVRKDNGDHEETKIDCQIISSFILEDEAKSQAINTVTNTTILNKHDIMPDQSLRWTLKPTTVYEVQYKILANGMLVKVTGDSDVSVTPESKVMKNVVVTSTKNTTLVNALDVKGQDVEVTPGMKCFVTRTSPVHNMRKKVPCGLLQKYAESSIKLVNADPSHNGSIGTCRFYMLTIMTSMVVFCVI